MQRIFQIFNSTFRWLNRDKEFQIVQGLLSDARIQEKGVISDANW